MVVPELPFSHPQCPPISLTAQLSLGNRSKCGGKRNHDFKNFVAKVQRDNYTLLILKRRSEDNASGNSQELGGFGIELEQSKSVGEGGGGRGGELFCSSEIREKIQRIGKEINDGCSYFSL